METTMPLSDKDYFLAKRKEVRNDLIVVVIAALFFLGAFLYTNLLITLVLGIVSFFFAEYLHAVHSSYTKKIKDIERQDSRRD